MDKDRGSQSEKGGERKRGSRRRMGEGWVLIGVGELMGEGIGRGCSFNGGGEGDRGVDGGWWVGR